MDALKAKKKRPSEGELFAQLARGDVLGASNMDWLYAKQILIPLYCMTHLDGKFQAAAIEDAKRFYDQMVDGYNGDHRRSAIIAFCGGCLEPKIHIKLLPFMPSSAAVNCAFESWFSYPFKVGEPPRAEELSIESNVVRIKTEDDFFFNLKDMMPDTIDGDAILLIKNEGETFRNTLSMFDFMGELTTCAPNNVMREIQNSKYVSVRATSRSFFITGMDDESLFEEIGSMFGKAYAIEQCTDDAAKELKPLVEKFREKFWAPGNPYSDRPIFRKVSPS